MESVYDDKSSVGRGRDGQPQVIEEVLTSRHNVLQQNRRQKLVSKSRSHEICTIQSHDIHVLYIIR